MRTHAVDKLLEQHCYKFAPGLVQLVRFYSTCVLWFPSAVILDLLQVSLLSFSIDPL